MQSFFNTARTFTVRYAGLSFYWAWVFLSFNSSDLTVQGGAHEILSVVHIVSSIAAMVTFSLAVVFHRKIVEFSCERVGVALIIASLVASAGTLFYTFPGFSGNETLSIVGAIISGLTCSAIVLAWGVVYRGLNAREAVLFTSMTFFGAAVLYFVVSCLASGLSSVVVSLFPVCAAVLAALSLKIPKGNTSQVLESTVSAGWVSDLSQLLSSGLSWRVLLGLAVALFVCGGTRVYFADIAPGVFLDPALMTLPLVFSALVFFVYGIFVSRTSLNLGILYRIAMPLFAFALVLIALLEGDNAGLAFFVLSTASVLLEVLTWALLVEVTRTTHHPPLLIFAVGRLVVHVGIVAGELVALALIGNLVLFAILAICLLVISAGFTFADRDTTFLFESPTPEELQRLALIESAPNDDVLVSSNLMDRIDVMAQHYAFSPREKEVFTLWVTGRGSKYIQETFVISEATVKTHVRHIYEKCGVHNRAELMRKLEDILL